MKKTAVKLREIVAIGEQVRNSKCGDQRAQ